MCCLFGVFALGVTACGDDDDDDGGGGGSTAAGYTLTIYSSLPLQGTSKEQSEAVIDGEKLALKEAGSKVGKYKLKYVSLDDSTAQNPGTADEGQTAQNARKAVQDKSTIFYLGEFNSGGTQGLAADPQQGRHPADQPVEHLRRADQATAGLRAGRAGEVLPGRRRAPMRASCRPTTSRARRWPRR